MCLLLCSAVPMTIARQRGSRRSRKAVQKYAAPWMRIGRDETGFLYTISRGVSSRSLRRCSVSHVSRSAVECVARTGWICVERRLSECVLQSAEISRKPAFGRGVGRLRGIVPISPALLMSSGAADQRRDGVCLYESRDEVYAMLKRCQCRNASQEVNKRAERGLPGYSARAFYGSACSSDLYLNSYISLDARVCMSCYML